MASGQVVYPADSLLKNPDISVLKKMALLPIAGWQRISYNSHFFNCQFYPSCSNYGMHAIQKFGVIKGTMMTTDRIVRCNPAARDYHLKSKMEINNMGYLVDPVTPVAAPEKTQMKSPLVAAGLSALIPGLGRAYSGRIFEGLLGGLMTFLIGQIALEAYQNDRPVKASMFSAYFISFYSGEIYGAYRTTKYYNTKPIREVKP